MPHANGNGAEIYYEVDGPADGEPLLFIEGARVQMVGWRPAFIQRFLDRGYRVIRFDNRDVGLSQKFGGPEDLDGGYDMADMAADSFSVLDALGLTRAHIIGQSMGGVIAQVMAGKQPHRVKTLSLIYTTPSLDPEIIGSGASDPRIMAVQPRLSRTEAIELEVEMERMSASSEFPFDEAWIRELATLSYDRCYAPEAIPRHFQAILRMAGKPFADYAKLTMPAAIIHGRQDRLLNWRAALELARLIPHAEAHIFQGMGHEIAQPLWDDYVSAITRTIERGRKHP